MLLRILSSQVLIISQVDTAQLPWQPIPVFDHPYSKKFSLKFKMFFFFLFLYVPIASCPSLQAEEKFLALIDWTVGLDAWLYQEWVKSKCQT